MNARIDAIYARQSVDREDSISIESQIEFSKYELRGGNYTEYIDKGFSGKNTDRPRFQELVQDIEKGLVARVVVYKLDRISRSILDFSNMMELFQKYDVEFVSSTEKFDTATPMGRAMLNICIVFAQLERETIQKRVTDAYYSRSEKGLHMSGSAPYGYKLEPTVVNGIRTKMLVPDPETADYARLIFEMYAEPDISYGDITRYFADHGISFFGRELQRTAISLLLRNPSYTQADLSIYEYFKSQGAVIINDASDFTGANSCYLYSGREVKSAKNYAIKDHRLVLAPHEGIVSSELWMTVCKKLMNNMRFSGQHKAKNTWLAGKVKCGRCGSGLMHQSNQYNNPYFRCRKRADRKTCEGCGTLRVREIEDAVFHEMRKKMADFKILENSAPREANPKLTALKLELAQIEQEIEDLLNTLTGASAVLMTYANSKIEELDTRRQAVTKAIAEMTTAIVAPEQLQRISDHLDNWDNISFDDRRLVVADLISVIRLTSDKMQIAWNL